MEIPVEMDTARTSEENRIVVIGRINDRLTEMNFYTDENCDLIVHWLRKKKY